MDDAAAPLWAKGFDLPFLQGCAEVFKRQIRPHTYGAFGLPKESEVATARADGQLIWTRDPEGLISTAAIFRLAESRSSHEDFAGRAAAIQPGDIFVRSIAGDQKGVHKILAALRDKASPPAIWVEAFVEDPEIVQALTSWGCERVMTKISASSDLKGLFLWGERAGRMPPGLAPVDLPSMAHMAPDFISEPERLAVLHEAEAFKGWAQHYSSYNKGKTWTAFALQGFDPADPGFIIKPGEMSRKWKADNPARMGAPCGPTSALEHFPTAAAIMARIPGSKERVRLMRLSASGGELTRHADITDQHAGTGPGKLMRLHIPLQSHPDCYFRTWELDGRETRTHMAERGLYYLDTRKPHAVVNPAGVERIHFVLDTFAGAEIRRSVVAAGALKT